MNSCWNDDTFLIARLARGYGQVVAFIASQGRAEGANGAEFALLCVSLDGEEVVSKLGVSVGVAVSEVDEVIVELEFMSESKGIIGLIEFEVFSLNAIRVVADWSATSIPANIFFFNLSFGVNQDLHPMIEQGIWLREVHEIESNRQPFSSVSHSKEEPLSMTTCIDIIWEEEIVLIVWNFEGWKQVSRLEPWFKDKSWVC